VLIAVCAPAAFAADGELDPTFASGRSGADQQQVTRINRFGHVPPPEAIVVFRR
jgi:hypothetical protein